MFGFYVGLIWGYLYVSFVWEWLFLLCLMVVWVGDDLGVCGMDYCIVVIFVILNLFIWYGGVVVVVYLLYCLVCGWICW